MKHIRILLLFALLCYLFAAYADGWTTQDDTSYIESIRKEYDQWVRDNRAQGMQIGSREYKERWLNTLTGHYVLLSFNKSQEATEKKLALLRESENVAKELADTKVLERIRNDIGQVLSEKLFQERKKWYSPHEYKMTNSSKLLSYEEFWDIPAVAETVPERLLSYEEFWDIEPTVEERVSDKPLSYEEFWDITPVQPEPEELRWQAEESPISLYGTEQIFQRAFDAFSENRLLVIVLAIAIIMALLCRIMRNRNQTRNAVIGIGVALVILMAVFPPYVGMITTVEGSAYLKVFMGYHPLFRPPISSDVAKALGHRNASGPRYRAEIDVPRLGVQFVACILATLGIAFITGAARRSRSTAETHSH